MIMQHISQIKFFPSRNILQIEFQETLPLDTLDYRPGQTKTFCFRELLALKAFNNTSKVGDKPFCAKCNTNE